MSKYSIQIFQNRAYIKAGRGVWSSLLTDSPMRIVRAVVASGFVTVPPSTQK
jgi:hypothetical protein